MDEVCVIVPVKTEEEEVKPNVQECAVHGNSAVSNQSGELFSDVSIKKEESEDNAELNDSLISVKGKLLDEVSGRSFDELVTAANNGKQEDVDLMCLCTLTLNRHYKQMTKIHSTQVINF